MKLKPNEWKMLEKCFDAEVGAAIGVNARIALAQFSKRNTALAGLHSAGLIEPQTVRLPGRFCVTVSGWVLTERGRIAWCEHAAADYVPCGVCHKPIPKGDTSCPHCGSTDFET